MLKIHLNSKNFTTNLVKNPFQNFIALFFTFVSIKFSKNEKSTFENLPFSDGAILDYSSHELNEKDLKNITKYFTS